MDQDINEQIKGLESEINGLIEQLDDEDINIEDVDSDDLIDFELDIKTGLLDADPLKLVESQVKTETTTSNIKEEIKSVNFPSNENVKLQGQGKSTSTLNISKLKYNYFQILTF